MGYIEKRGKNSWRLYTQVNVAGQMQPVRVTLRMDPSLPESVQRRDAQRELRLLEARLAGASSDVPTLQQWSDSWLANMDPETSPVTVANYKYLLTSRILPQLGPLRCRISRPPGSPSGCAPSAQLPAGPPASRKRISPGPAVRARN